jgi:hypothetical protein
LAASGNAERFSVEDFFRRCRSGALLQFLRPAPGCTRLSEMHDCGLLGAAPFQAITYRVVALLS